MTELPKQDFDGDTYQRELDFTRLTGQNQAVFDSMNDGAWRTLREIEDRTGYPQASISARLRDFRKEKFGRHKVHRRRRGTAVKGLHEYSLHRRACLCDLCLDTLPF